MFCHWFGGGDSKKKVFSEFPQANSPNWHQRLQNTNFCYVTKQNINFENFNTFAIFIAPKLRKLEGALKVAENRTKVFFHPKNFEKKNQSLFLLPATVWILHVPRHSDGIKNHFLTFKKLQVKIMNKVSSKMKVKND